MLECAGPEEGPCRSHLPGHRLPRLLTEVVRRSPWGWRPGVVSAVSPDGWLSLECREGRTSSTVRAWHHHDLAGRLPVGSSVRLHQRGSVGCGHVPVLAGPTGLVSLHVAQGPEPVPDLVDLDTWADPAGAVVIDLRTRALITP